SDGIHLVVATIKPREETPAGLSRGEIKLQWGDATLGLPLELRMSPVLLKPMKHFGTVFGATFFLVAYKSGEAGVTQDAISAATFHGYRGMDLTPRTMMSLSIPDTPDPRTARIRPLVEKYLHALLDHHLMPQSPALYAYFSYDVV